MNGAECKRVTWSGGTANLDPAVRVCFDATPWLERKLSGWMVLRILSHNPRRAREIERYGPAGAVDLARARAWQLWIVITLIPWLVLQVFGVADGGVGSFLAYVALSFLLSISRLVAARREGRRWRASRGSGET